MYATTLIHRAMDGPEIGSLLRGRDVPGLEITGAAYNFGPKTPFLSQSFLAMAENGMRAKTIHYSSDERMELFWILKKNFWLCGVYLNHPETIATVVELAPSPALSFYGLDLIAEKLDLRKGDIKGLEGLLAERATDMIVTIPKQGRIVMLEGD